MSSVSSAIASATSSAVSSTASSSSSSSGSSQPASYKVIGIVLAVVSGLLIGSSFILKKKGLLRATLKAGNVAGEGHPYLKSPLWWTGMIIMIVGEICNLIAYSFADAILVTPMGSIAVVTSGALSHFVLKERLTTFGWIGSALCVLGSIIIALNGPSSHDSADIDSFMHLFIAPGFLVWLGLTIAASVGMIFFVAPRWGKKNMLVYIGICSLLGGLSVACTSGLGSAILTAIRGDKSQWGKWFLWFLLAFCVITLLLEVNYLNKALELFNTAMVTPVYFVIFTSCTLVTSIILHKGFSGSTTSEIITLVLGFLVICLGITILQLSKIDPEDLKESAMLDRRSTVLLAATRSSASIYGDHNEKRLDTEDPGIDTVRGAAGAIGSIRRAISMRRSMSTMGGRQGGSGFGPEAMGVRRRGRNGAPGAGGSGPSELEMGMRSGSVPRFQLYDQPMPADASDKISLHSNLASPSPSFNGRQRSSTIKFSEVDNLHQYSATPGRDSTVHHSEQQRLGDAHTHRDIASPTFLPPPSSATSSQFPTSPLGKGDFSAARSGSLFSSPAYLDPYSDKAVIEEEENGGRSGSPTSYTAYSPDSPRAQTLPRRQDSSRTSSTTTRPSLAERLGSAFSSSSPNLHAHDFGAPPEQGGDSKTLPSSATRRHFGGDHRVPHPRGPRDLDAHESEALVSSDERGRDSLDGNGRGRRDSSSDDEEGDEALGGRLETYDSRDQL
ncbi:hypothetical protein JCM8547_008407 [Rhodosporidiobolus lusitaniae]